MKTRTLREPHPPYHIDLDGNTVFDEVLVLEKEGMPVAAIVPIAEYMAFQSWRDAQRRHTEPGPEDTAIDREHRAFQQMLPELLRTHRGRVVAIYQGQVVADGDDRLEVWQRARQQLGSVPVYVQRVEASPKIYKMPQRKVAHLVAV
jgi:hypothetical protein